MAKLIPKSNILKQDVRRLSDGTTVRVLSKEEALARIRARREGKIPKRDDPEMELLPADAIRKRKRRNITLSDEALRIARKLADGNVSRGIDRALTHYAECALANRRGRPKKSKPDLT